MFLTSFLSVPALVLSCVYIIAYFNALVNSFFKTFSSFFKFFYFCFSAHYRNSEQFDNDNYYQFTAMERRYSWLPTTPITRSPHMLLYALYITHIIYLLVFIIFILYRSVFRARAIRSYSFPVNIYAQYSLVGLPSFLHYTITLYIFAELFYIIILSVLLLLSIYTISIIYISLSVPHIFSMPYTRSLYSLYSVRALYILCIY